MPHNDTDSGILKLPAPFVIEALRRNHKSKSFSCGEGDLDFYVQRFALTNAKKGFSKTYVAAKEGEPQIQGYYSISADSVSLQLMPEPAGMPSKIPLILIGRLAVDSSQQGSGIGSDLLIHALRTSLGVADSLGIYAVAVEALNERARCWYLKLGFTPFTDSPLHLFLPMNQVRALFPVEA